MRHSIELTKDAQNIEEVPLIDSDQAEISFQSIDRTIPSWSLAIALAYGLVNFAIFLAVAIMPVFIFDLVAIEGQLHLAALLVAMLVVPLFGTLLIDFAFRWSLSGLKEERTQIASRASGILGIVGLLLLTFVQPYFFLPTGIAVVASIAVLFIVLRFDPDEKAWHFNKNEAVSILSGRDDFGFSLALRKSGEHSLAVHIQRVGTAFAGLTGFALASWLASREILTLEAVAALAFVSMLLTDMLLRATRSYFFAGQNRQPGDTVVRPLNEHETDGLNNKLANLEHFSVENLSVTDREGNKLLDGISFDVLPGSLLQISGSSGDGKSLLLRALSDPFGLSNCEVRGRVTIAGSDLWRRESRQTSFPAVRVDACPKMLTASARQNLTCFQPELGLDRAKHFLRQIVYSQDIIERLTADDVAATQLPMMQQKVLGLSRAFLISPQILLLDCPEAFLPEQQVNQVLKLLKSQTRLGRIALLVTENRSLMEACDKVLVLQAGRAVDFGDGTEIRARHGSGWRRFTGSRQLETEAALHSWLCAQFIRNGDDGNRRKVCKIGSNLLAHFCLSVPADDHGTIVFECKQKAGFLELRVSDDREPISTIQIEQARSQLRDENLTTQLSPLAQILRDANEIGFEGLFGNRHISLEIETYDPRKKTISAG